MSESVGGTSVPVLETCVYPGSKLKCRGPARKLDGDFIAVVGGAETLSPHLSRDVATVIEETTGLPCVNFSAAHAGPSAYLADTALLMQIARARAVVLSIPGAHLAKNSCFRVHPVRNDRVVGQSSGLQALYPEVDFLSHPFVRHMLGEMMRVSPGRFAVVRDAMRKGWASGMADLIGAIDAPVYGLWLGTRRPEQRTDALEAGDPSFVTRRMLGALNLAGLAEIVRNGDRPLPGADMIDEAGQVLSRLLTDEAAPPMRRRTG
ncbi:hypothetical protein SAMN04488020_107234 [Palleronia marisminoris]|uniref:DUF6473 domain-containing protein n=1 Tax=Palleronia marisminoris TaxID=315423 RepID=A0A1Y5T593_9RHOB|nr:DUF6473 family protein [Palleronia marisminoris]SFH17802.1 hypothetical protein SAMN04488020_107234 [Palleronia marisminoris]SLN56177.1 hypothetical protein PAM7066_02708 [Palleronia marisminoris]